MNLSAVISISGKPGLSKIVKQSRNGIIVESLVDGSRFPVHGTERVSSLEDISIYTYEEDILLSKVFELMNEKYEGKESISHKSSAKELSEAFKEILPNYDAERVYSSDIKKVFQWYNLLVEKGLMQENAEEEKEEEKNKSEQKEDEKPNKKDA